MPASAKHAPTPNAWWNTLARAVRMRAGSLPAHLVSAGTRENAILAATATPSAPPAS